MHSLRDCIDQPCLYMWKPKWKLGCKILVLHCAQREHRLWSQQIWVKILVLPLANPGNMNKWLGITDHQAFYIKTELIIPKDYQGLFFSISRIVDTNIKDCYKKLLINVIVYIKTNPYGKHISLCSFSCVQLSATPWTVAHQSFLSMGFFRQEYWSGLPCPS